MASRTVHQSLAAIPFAQSKAIDLIQLDGAVSAPDTGIGTNRIRDYSAEEKRGNEVASFQGQAGTSRTESSLISSVSPKNTRPISNAVHKTAAKTESPSIAKYSHAGATAKVATGTKSRDVVEVLSCIYIVVRRSRAHCIVS